MGGFWSQKQPEQSTGPVYERTTYSYSRVEPSADELRTGKVIPFERIWLALM